jgi:predicted enzyme related to lactoylglutathione lyase
MRRRRSSDLSHSIALGHVTLGQVALGQVRPRPAPFNRAFRVGLFSALLGAVWVAPVMAQQLQLPAIVEPASPEHHTGKVVFVELVTPDIAAAKQFYGSLLGWTFRDLPAGGTGAGGVKYAEAYLDGRAVAGLVHWDSPAGQHPQSSWLSFIAVRDVDATAKIAAQEGAKTLFAPHSLPDRGREAVFADPQGAVFAVVSSTSGDPPDLLADPGEWIWSSLITRDPDADAAFYQVLFDYEVFDLPQENGEETGVGQRARHLMLATGDYARASVNSMPASRADIHPYWLNYVRVDDAVKTAAKAVALGGQVIVPPRLDRHGGMIAVVTDPLGAPFGLLEWPGTESKEVTK